MLPLGKIYGVYFYERQLTGVLSLIRLEKLKKVYIEVKVLSLYMYEIFNFVSRYYLRYLHFFGSFLKKGSDITLFVVFKRKRRMKKMYHSIIEKEILIRRLCN